MADYFWSARFICGAVTVAIAVSLLVGAALLLPHDGSEARYFLVIGAALCPTGVLLAAASRPGLGLYALISAAAIAYSVYHFGLDIWLLMPHLFSLLVWGAILFTLRHRIAPTRDPNGPAMERFRAAWRRVRRSIEESS